LEDYATVSSILQAFEAERLPRVSTIWDREWQMSEAAYSSSSSIPSPQTTADYDEFVNAGV
jgi:hypothetical protein